MIRPELRSLYSPDVPDLDLEHFAPDPPDDFLILVGASIGVAGEPGQDMFYFIVTTPRVLDRKIVDDGYLLPRHYLLLHRFDYDTLWSAIGNLCQQVETPDWPAAASRLARYGQWEFEDYQEEPDPRRGGEN